MLVMCGGGRVRLGRHRFMQAALELLFMLGSFRPLGCQLLLQLIHLPLLFLLPRTPHVTPVP